jgi:translation initiation factor RLI1
LILEKEYIIFLFCFFVCKLGGDGGIYGENGGKAETLQIYSGKRRKNLRKVRLWGKWSAIMEEMIAENWGGKFPGGLLT